MLNHRLKIATTGIVGAVGLGIGLLGAPEAAKAIECGADYPPGLPGWVDLCPAGLDNFPSFLEFDLELDLDGNGTPETPISLTATGGSTKIWRSEGNGGVIQTEIYDLLLTGTSAFGDFTIRAGDGIGNGINDGPLYTFGAITQRTDDIGTPEDESALADSFFEVFFEIEGLEGLNGGNPLTITNNAGASPTRIRLEGDRGMAGLGGAYPQSGPVGVKHGPVENPCTPIPIPSTVEYCSTNDPVLVFGDFDNNGTFERFVGISLSERHVPRAPEPSTILGLIAVGIGGLFGVKRKKDQK